MALTSVPLINAQLDMLNHLISHQNAALDLLASDKRAALASDIGLIAELIHAGELLQVMDYGDKIATGWNDGETHYTPELNLCHIENGILEDGETVPVADFEWDKTLPFNTQFSAPQAIYESESDLPAGTYYFRIKNDGWGGNNDKCIQFTLASAMTAGKQIRKKSGAYNAAIENCTLGIFASGADTTGETLAFTVETTPSGTNLGDTDGTGDLNHWSRVVLGHNRWATSALRQWLNSSASAGNWWSKKEKWEVKPDYASKAGFLSGYDAEVVHHFKATKVVTGKNTVTDGGGVDITYDKVFLRSLEQMYVSPQLSSEVGSEGEYWEYYKRLLGRTTPAARQQTYTRLIKYAIGTTSAQYCWARSASLGSAINVWLVYSSGYVGSHAANHGGRCAPVCRIGL